MKKVWLALVGVAMAFSASAADITEGKQYEVMNKAASAEPQITEFFSFYCPACFQFDQVYHISNQLKDVVPEGGSYRKYHASFMGGETGVMLTQAWAVAMTLNIEEKIKPLMFDAVQVKRNIRSLNDIRAVFVEAGVKPEEFDALWNSFVVKSLLVQQQREADSYQLASVPSVFVNGKYQIMNKNMTSMEEFLDVAKFLMTQK